MVKARCIELGNKDDKRVGDQEHPSKSTEPFSASRLGMRSRPLLGINRRLSKVKRGLLGSANGARVSALPDTGSFWNIISVAFARVLTLDIEGSPSDFI